MNINDVLTISDIAKELDYETQLVRYYVKKLNIKPTTTFRGMKLFSRHKAEQIKEETRKRVKHAWVDFNGNPKESE